MDMRKKIIVEEVLEDKQIQFSFDQDTPVGLLYQAADKFRMFIFEEIKKIQERDAAQMEKDKEAACQEKQENQECQA